MEQQNKVTLSTKGNLVKLLGQTVHTSQAGKFLHINILRMYQLPLLFFQIFRGGSQGLDFSTGL